MFLLDTNVVFEMRKIRTGKADRRVDAWCCSVAGTSLYLSAIVVQELEIGVFQYRVRLKGLCCAHGSTIMSSRALAIGYCPSIPQLPSGAPPCTFRIRALIGTA